ncbi:MAG: zf-HC2 domain-containing protein [Desulfobacteraceae bacterium]|nr:zf-HC2 domain-containing protein [Desulfobacteraceae bacterium]
MRCSKARKLISAFIDKELPEKKRRRLEDHLKVCGKCRKASDETLTLSGLFIDTVRFDAPYGFHARVMANLNNAEAKGFHEAATPTRTAWVVTLLAAVVGGLISGAFLANDLAPVKTKDTVMASLHLSVFESAPPDSLGRAYLLAMEGKNEE